MARGQRVLEFRIPSDVQCIERVVEAVRGECRRLAYAEHQLSLNVPVALTEAISNAILRGNAQDERKSVVVVARVDAARLVIEVSDQGSGFDLVACTRDPTTPEALESEDGRGLFLMRKLMDEVERVSKRGRNVVRMTLRRAG
ncbi:MAG TPA: ATP-binding protein [Gemmatimonadaceae bacterium]|jgi:serine/threonine-protein kinase RsbW|nr:ATP-binding protein [Gemmatimonadaceae bacterium]